MATMNVAGAAVVSASNSQVEVESLKKNQTDSKLASVATAIGKPVELTEKLKGHPDGFFKIAYIINYVRDLHANLSKSAATNVKMNIFVQNIFNGAGFIRAIEFMSSIPYWAKELVDDIKDKEAFNIGWMAGATLGSLIGLADWCRDVGLASYEKISANMSKCSFLRPLVKFGLDRVATTVTGIAFLFKGGDSIKKLVEASKLPAITEKEKEVKAAMIRQAAFDLAWSAVQVGIAVVGITAFAVASVATFWVGIPALAFGLVAVTLGAVSLVHKLNNEKALDAAKKGIINVRAKEAEDAAEKKAADEADEKDKAIAKEFAKIDQDIEAEEKQKAVEAEKKQKALEAEEKQKAADFEKAQKEADKDLKKLEEEEKQAAADKANKEKKEAEAAEKQDDADQKELDEFCKRADKDNKIDEAVEGTEQIVYKVKEQADTNNNNSGTV